ncbi:MAG TPA: DinB family protein [Blastocatellia bacterium]|nr:DinB family protein [Blastocatellia bacterium]
MRPKAIRLLCFLFVVVVCAPVAFAQSEAKKPADDKRSPIVKETEYNWKRAKKWTLDYIDAMPENAMSFKPTSEIRSFAEQMLHLAFWNYGIGEAVTGKANPYGKKQEELEKRDDVKTKTALRKVVEESYDNLLAAIAGLDEAKMLEQVSFFNTKLTRVTALAIALDHQTHHRGQTTIYLRLKGVTPPPEP